MALPVEVLLSPRPASTGAASESIGSATARLRPRLSTPAEGSGLPDPDDPAHSAAHQPWTLVAARIPAIASSLPILRIQAEPAGSSSAGLDPLLQRWKNVNQRLRSLWCQPPERSPAMAMARAIRARNSALRESITHQGQKKGLSFMAGPSTQRIWGSLLFSMKVCSPPPG